MKWVLRTFMLAGIVGVSYSVWALLDGIFYQTSQRTHFNEEVALLSESSLPLLPPPPSASLPVRAPAVPAFLPRIASVFERDPAIMGEFLVSRINMSVMFREGIDDETLRRAAGHVPSTALPGETGNSVLIAHRDTFFRPLRDIQMNDVVRLRTRQGEFRYIVDSLSVVEPSGISLAGNNGEATLTLITCYPFGYVGPAPRRFVARAHMVETRSRGRW